MLHGYFMAPLEPSRFARKVRTLCHTEVPTVLLAFPGYSRITCADCAQRASAIRVSYHKLHDTTGIAEQRTQAKRYLSRLDLLLLGHTPSADTTPAQEGHNP